MTVSLSVPVPIRPPSIPPSCIAITVFSVAPNNHGEADTELTAYPHHITTWHRILSRKKYFSCNIMVQGAFAAKLTSEVGLQSERTDSQTNKESE